MLLQYGSLAAVRAAVTDDSSRLSQGMRAKLAAAAEYLDAALPVVRVATDAQVQMSRPDVLPQVPADPARLDDLARRWGVERPVTSLVAALAGQ